MLTAAHDEAQKTSGTIAVTMDATQRWAWPTEAMQSSIPLQDVSECMRVPGETLSPAAFLKLVRTSQPVVLSGLLSNWSSLASWSLDHLLQRARNSTVKVYSSPDRDFESVRQASDLLPPHGQRVCSDCTPDEPVLIRPAETEIPFSTFAWLISGAYENRERANFYLQKHEVRKWTSEKLVDDVSPAPHERIAPYLRLEHELLWLSGEGHCPVAPLHYDENENLHALVQGSKRFTLFHPSAGKTALYDGQKMRSLHYLWRWAANESRGYMHALNPMASTPAYQPFSPVNLREPNLRAHPHFARARRLVCDVHKGDVLFLPSYWWHHVEAIPAASSPSSGGGARHDSGRKASKRCPLTISVNYFFTPFFRKASDLQHFQHEPFYNFLRDGGDPLGGPGEWSMGDSDASDPERWRPNTTRDAEHDEVEHGCAVDAMRRDD